MLVDSHDGERLPELIGNYVESLASGKKHWSTVHEIRTWINDTHVTGPLSDRECRALRRHASLANATNGATALGAAEGNINASQADDEDVRSLMSNSGSAYVLENVLQRAAKPGTRFRTVKARAKTPFTCGSHRQLFRAKPSSAGNKAVSGSSTLPRNSTS